LAAPIHGPRMLDCKRTCDATVAQTCGTPGGTLLSQRSWRRCARSLWRQCHRLLVTCVTTTTTTSTTSTEAPAPTTPPPTATTTPTDASTSSTTGLPTTTTSTTIHTAGDDFLGSFRLDATKVSDTCNFTPVVAAMLIVDRFLPPSLGGELLVGATDPFNPF